MIEYRPFRNSDPPALAQIWRGQPPAWGLMQPMTPAMWDELVLSKPYFDRNGLLLAWEDGRAVGFAHACFGPNADRTWLDFEVGATCLLMVAHHPRQSEMAAELLVRSEEYLIGRGARSLCGGTSDRFSPFYLGLYGGSGSPGVLSSDQVQLQAFNAAGYSEDSRRIVLQRELADFHLPVDRQLSQWRRQLCLEVCADRSPADWWEACIFGQIERVGLVLNPRDGGPAWGRAEVWDVEPLASSWGVHAMGLLELQLHVVPPDAAERSALCVLLLGEVMRYLHSWGVTLLEVQAGSGEVELLDLCQKLGFRQIQQGICFRKSI